MNQFELDLRKKIKLGRKIVCAYLTLGYPSLRATEVLIREFERAGVDIVELGFPFSDPMADGPTIQRASDYSLSHHVMMRDAFELVTKLRKAKVEIPILFFSYYNPMYHVGLRRTSCKLKQAGFQGAIIPDLPPQEGAECQNEFGKNDLSLVFLVAPTTDEKRMRSIANASNGFIYYVSLRGVTGVRKSLDPEIKTKVKQLKKITEKPVLVGFGVSSPKQARTLCQFSDGVIVGSAIINQLAGSDQNVSRAIRFVKSLVKAVRLAE